MKDAALLDEDYNLIWLLNETQHIVTELREQELSQYQITPRQSAILLSVKALGSKATPSEIARFTFRRPHSISGILNRMEKLGLITKVKDLGRKNLVRVALTEKGEQAHSQSLKREAIHKVVASLSEQECRQLRLCLGKLRDEGLKGLATRHESSFAQSFEFGDRG